MSGPQDRELVGATPASPRAPHGCRRPAARRSRQRGHTLIEVMVVLVIVGILSVAAVPGYRRAEEQARVDSCAAALRSIWNAQRAYWLENHSYADSFDALKDAGYVDAAAFDGGDTFTYSLDQAGATTFAASATRSEGAWSGSLAIDESGAITGSTTDEGGASVAPASH